MTQTHRISFQMMSLIHETLYGLFRDPYKALNAAGLEAGQQVLEIGCGPGFFTVPAARIVGETGSVLAVDVNPLAAEHVQRKIETEGAANAKAMSANAARMDLPDQFFDLAFVFGFAHPIGGIEAIWLELYRLLKPTGILSIEGRLRPPGELFQLVKRGGRIFRFKKIG